MPGSDHVLSKGFLVDSGAGAITFGQALQLVAGPGVADQPVKVTVATSPTAVGTIGLAGESIDAAKVATGKAFVNVNMMGVAKGIASATIATPVPGTGLTVAAGGKLAVAVATNYIVGLLLTFQPSPGIAANDIIDVFLTPSGVKFA